MTAAREDQIQAVMAAAGFGGAVRTALTGDASTRSYERLHRGGRRAILMNAPPRAETAPCPPGADPAARAQLGYNAQARLAAGRIEAFLGVAQWLRGHDLAAPEILAADAQAGLAVIEDFGDGQYWALLQTEAPAAPLYEAAIEALARVHEEPAPARLPAGAGAWPLLSYDRVALHAEVALLADWFAPSQLQRPISGAARDEWIAAWDKAFVALDEARPVLTLRDFHSPNLMWLHARDGAQRAGLLDFQDALAGHPAYDLVSLLEDARRTVAPDFAAHWLAAYLDAAAVIDREAFRAAYAVLGAQRNAKIIGIFARLKFRDGKPHYVAQHQPRVIQYFRRNLEHPALATVAAWFARHLPLSDWAKAESAAA
jgi:N-acetylmuramate 1-kinase